MPEANSPEGKDVLSNLEYEVNYETLQKYRNELLLEVESLLKASQNKERDVKECQVEASEAILAYKEKYLQLAAIAENLAQGDLKEDSELKHQFDFFRETASLFTPWDVFKPTDDREAFDKFQIEFELLILGDGERLYEYRANN